MLTIELPALNRLQLRRLLDVARRDGDEELAADILAEFARRERGAPPEPSAPIAAPPPPVRRRAPQPPPAPRLRWLVPAFAAGLVLGVGLALGAALGWRSGQVARVAVPQAAQASAPAPAPAPPPYRAAVALTPPPAPPPPAASLHSLTVAGPSSPLSAPHVQDCAAPAHPADRAICADPALLRLRGELDAAYAEALSAHHDHRAQLEARQAAWQAARDGVAEPARLTQLYAARVRALKAATAAARRGASPPA